MSSRKYCPKDCFTPMVNLKAKCKWGKCKQGCDHCK
jgi:hypothetical protein